MSKTVIFVSDSNMDVYSDRALVGTEAYRVFLEYLAALDLSINDSLLYNEKDYRTIEAIAVSDMDVKVVALGKIAEKAIKKLDIPYFSLPITGSISKLQSLDFKALVDTCKDFVHDRKGQ